MKVSPDRVTLAALAATVGTAVAAPTTLLLTISVDNELTNDIVEIVQVSTIQAHSVCPIYWLVCILDKPSCPEGWARFSELI